MLFMSSFGQLANNAVSVSGKNSELINSAKPSLLERHRVWLNLTNTGGAFKQLLVGYIEGATNGYDSDFDGISLNANAFIDFYSINSGRNLVIQGRALPFSGSDVVPLGFRTVIAGEFTISIGQVDGVLANQSIFIVDKLTNKIHDLKQGGYVFDTAIGIFNNRFELRYNDTVLTTNDFVTSNNEVSVGIKNEIININSTVGNIDKIFIYDISGKQLLKNENIRDTQLRIQDLSSPREILLVKVFLENGYSTTKKALFK